MLVSYEKQKGRGILLAGHYLIWTGGSDSKLPLSRCNTAAVIRGCNVRN
jgi:hypothetical protein